MLRGRLRTDAIPDPPASGWPSLYRTVREADVNKVDDCREDIDTLLVFAGLYSAVLTAFVIESYTHLQQDPQDVIISLLQQIATRNYISGPGFINSTIPSTSPPPFEPPLWAVRVNILWFASLLLSLSSASFGILVKQWLREYLAIEYTVPQQRLRARQYRYPALAQWKVFEIAAFLPLLLQLSLGLFFAGLCFFTSAVHSSIGNTTIPLVSAWVFLLFVMTIAPLFSPRCPFKTTFLKRALRAGRRYVALLSYDITQSISRATQVVSARTLPYFQLIQSYISRITTVVHRWRAAAGRAVYSSWRNVLTTAHRYLECVPSASDYSRAQCFRRIRRAKYATQKKKALLEEDEVVKAEAEDVDVLVSVDSLMSDDGLLPIMLNALRQQSEISSSAKIFGFVSRIVGHRIGQDLDGKLITSISDLHHLTKLCWSVLTDAVADAFLCHGLGTLAADATNTREWIIGSIIILNSRPNDQLSDHAASTIRKIILAPARMPDHGCSGGIPLFHCLAQATGAFDGVTCLRCVIDTYRTLLCKGMGDDGSHLPLRHILDTHMSEDLFVASSKGLLQALICVLASFLEDAVSSQKDPAEIPGSGEALHIILQYGEKFGMRDDAVTLCRRMLSTESSTRMLLAESAALHSQCRVCIDVPAMFWDVHRSNRDADDTIQSHLTAACERFCDGGGDDVPVDYVRLSAAFTPWLCEDEALPKAIAKYHRTRGWRKEIQRREYWYSDSQSPTPEELFKEDQDLACEVLLKWWGISAKLRDALWMFVPEERSEEVLRSIREDCPEYTPPTPPAPSTGLLDSNNGQGGTSTAKGAQEVGDAEQEGHQGMGSRTGGRDAKNAEASGGVDVDTVVPAEDDRICYQDATEHEPVKDIGAENDGNLGCGGGGAQGMLAMAGN